ncbi:DUF2637 domain-containing protein, partial [Streptomyces sp. 2MCAF27]
MSLRTGLVVGAGAVAGIAMAASAATLASLGEAVGWHEPLHWSLPVSVDVLALVAGVAWLAAGVSPAARKLGRTLTLVSVVVSVVLNAISHLVGTGYMVVGPQLVIGVSAVPPLAAALAVHLTAAVVTNPPAKVGDGAPAEPVPGVSPDPGPRVMPAVPEPQVTHEGQGNGGGVPRTVHVPEIELTGTGSEPVAICGGGHLPIPTVPPRPRLGA